MSALPAAASLSWLGIVRLGLVQTALGAIVVLTTSTLNRVMVVELALPAMLPGALVALHYAVQVSRPRMGHGSDQGGRRTPWIIGGMAVLAFGGLLAAVATALLPTSGLLGTSLAVIAFIMIGAGVGAAGTTLLVLLAKRVAPERRGAAAAVCWMMMIVGFVITATTAGRFLDPFSLERLVAVTAAVCAIAFVVALLAVAGVERAGVAHRGNGADAADGTTASPERVSFRAALAEVWQEQAARRFTIFVFVSMLAYSAQDLIVEPFAGTVFGYTPGQSTQLAGLQHAGVFAGMVIVALATSVFGGDRMAALRAWTVAGCIASAVALMALGASGLIDPAMLQPVVFALGVANGAFAVAAIGSMMGLAGSGRAGREGMRMGLWGAAQAIAFGLGGFLGTVAVDIARGIVVNPAHAYGGVFVAEGLLFIVAAVLALRVGLVGGTPLPSGLQSRLQFGR